MTAQLTLKTLKCLRQHDLTGVDEPEIWVDGNKYYSKPLDKDGHFNVPAPDDVIRFSGSIKVALYEASGSADHVDRKQIGTSYKVTESNPPPSPMDFKTSGSHYTLTFSVSPLAS